MSAVEFGRLFTYSPVDVDGGGAGVGATVGAAVVHSEHPLHPLYLHFCVQSAAFVPHHDLHCPAGVGAEVGAEVGAAVGTTLSSSLQTVQNLHSVSSC